jgi:hypothetical protein
VSRISLFIGLLTCGLLVGAARADTYKLTSGQEISGEILPTTATDAGVQIKTGEGTFQQVSWTSFSQEDLKRFSGNAKLAGFIEPFIEVNPQEKFKKTEVKLQPPPRLLQPPLHSLLGALFSSGLGFFTLLLLYAANLYAAYEIAIFRAQSVPLVCGVSAVLPIAGPILFLSRPTKLPPSEPAVEMVPDAESGAAATPVVPVVGATTDVLNPMAAEGAAHPAGLKLHAEDAPKPTHPPSTTYQRGQFTFNRRFIETKFASFFGVVRREAEKDMVLVIKSARGEYIGQRISRIASNDLHLEVHRGSASEEVMIPFQEIQQIVLKHKDAK